MYDLYTSVTFARSIKHYKSYILGIKLSIWCSIFVQHLNFILLSLKNWNIHPSHVSKFTQAQYQIFSSSTRIDLQNHLLYAQYIPKYIPYIILHIPINICILSSSNNQSHVQVYIVTISSIILYIVFKPKDKLKYHQ